MATLGQQEAFIQANLPYALQASGETGLPPDFILGQAAEETGWGSNTGYSMNNPFSVSPGGSLASYPSLQSGYDAYSTLIANRYSVTPGSSPTSIATQLQSEGYAQDTGYGPKVGGTTSVVDQVLNTLGLGQYAGGSSGAGSGSSGSGGTSSASGSGSSGGTGWLGGLEAWASGIAASGIWVVVGLILVAAALYIFGRDEGLIPQTAVAVPV